MAQGNFPRCCQVILRHEGGYADHPHDPGGATNYGITHKTLADWRGKDRVTKAEVRALQPTEAQEIYRSRYWNAVAGDDLPAGVDLMTFDFGVNAGNHRSAKMLQGIIGADQDGVIGPATLKRLSELDTASVIEAFAAARMKYYRGLRHWQTFGKGWTRRTAETKAEALAMVGTRPAAPRPTQGSNPLAALLAAILNLFRR